MARTLGRHASIGMLLLLLIVISQIIVQCVVVRPHQGDRHLQENDAGRSQRALAPLVVEGSEVVKNELPPPDRAKLDIPVYWIHIQKTGTSLFNTLYLHFCPSVITNDPSIGKRERPFMDAELLKAYPTEEYCNATFENMPCPGCHHPYPRQTKDGIKYHYFTMLRDPMERLKSAFSFDRHLSKLKEKDANISFEAYVDESHIPDCQLKMILGFNCGDYVDPKRLNITLAMERITSPLFFFGNTDRWNESICLFHKWYGGSTELFELKNNRKTKRVDPRGFRNYTFAETSFYNEAMKVFDDRVSKAGC